MALTRLRLAAKQAGVVEMPRVDVFGDGPLVQQRNEPPLVLFPSQRFLLVGVEDVARGRQLGVVLVVDVRDDVQKILQVAAFGEAGQLRDVVQPHVDQTLDAGFRERGEELLGRLAGETDRKERDRRIGLGRGGFGHGVSPSALMR